MNGISSIISDYYNDDPNDNSRRLFKTLTELFHFKFINIQWLKKYLLEVKMLGYNYNQMLWILSGIEYHQYKMKKSYISYELQSRLRFYINFDIGITDHGEISTLEFHRGDVEFILPKTIFDLDYTFIRLNSNEKDDIFLPNNIEDYIPVPIIQLPEFSCNAKVIDIDLFFLECLPNLWVNEKLESLTINKNKYLLLIPDKFDELKNIIRLTLKNIEKVPPSIYKNKSISTLRLIGFGKEVDLDKNKILNMQSIKLLELSSNMSRVEKLEFITTLENANIKAEIRI